MTIRLARLPELPAAPTIALVLGSGLGGLAERIKHPVQLPFHQVPGLEAASILGHKGCLTFGVWAGHRVLVFEGRLHGYEGHPWRTVVLSAQIARELGVRIFLSTNAAGGIRADLGPGNWLALVNHLDWTRPGFWRQPAAPSPYSTRLVGFLREAGRRLGRDLPTGTYAQVTGPSYETPAEIRALRVLGADAVGMSTAREIQAAFSQGMECAGLSLITNHAAGLGAGPLLHDDVLTTAGEQREHLGNLLETFLGLFPSEDPGS